MGHSPYVSLLLEKGIIDNWLNSEKEENINGALRLLGSVAEKIPDDVTKALEPYVERNGDWPSRVLNTICWSLVNDSENMFTLRLKLVCLGCMKDFVDWEAVCSKHPLRAIQLIETVLSTWDIDTVQNRNKQRGRLENWTKQDIEALSKVAQIHSVETWDLLIPHVERLTDFEAAPYEPRLDQWHKKRIDVGHTEIARGVVEMLMLAGQRLASEQPEELLKRTTPMENNISRIVQEIIIEVYAYLPQTHADSRITWLMADLSRLQFGSGYDEPKWMPAVRLLKALSPYCSEDLFQKLEKTIICYHLPNERELARDYLPERRRSRGDFYHYWGQAQYFLLPALCEKRISHYTAELIRVLKRKFGNYTGIKGTGRGGWVCSKLEPSIDKISNRAWLDIISNKKIIEKNSSKWIQVGKDKVLESSVRQFSGTLSRIAKRFPERFGQLALRFPDNVDPRYVSAIIDGLGKVNSDTDVPDEEKTSWQPASIETVESVVEKFQAGNDRETAKSFCWLISNRGNENWSDKAIDRLIYYAKNHPDLKPGQLNICCDKTADEATIETLFQNTINCVRGKTALAIGQLLWNHKDLLQKLRPAIESLINDPHPVVRMASIEALLPILNIDRDLAVDWFCHACKDDLRIAASPEAREFFNYTVQSHFKQLAPVIIEMVDSSIDEVAQEGALEVTARWLFYGFFEQELQKCRGGSSSQRKGVAQVASQFLHDSRYSSKCQELLLPLLNDPDKEVREKTCNMFNNDFFKQPTSKEFLERYIRTEAFADDPDRLLFILKELPGSLISFAETLFSICEVFSTNLKEASRNIGSRVPHAASQTSSLLLRLYEQAQTEGNQEIANRCLDIWDMLFENRVGRVRELTRAIEK